MADRTIEIIIKAEDQYSREMGEYNKAVGKMEDTTKKASQETGSLGSALGGLNSVVGAAAGLWAAWQVGSKIVEFQQLGSQVTAARNTFNELSGGATAAAETIRALQGVTRGTVDEFTLMSSSSQMLRTNVATNSDELARFTEMAIALKAPTDSAADALNNFTLMMSNESIARLDSYGISAARVRERINEMTASGEAANRSDAFRMAVLEVGATSMERLGSSIEANVSNVDRLSVRWDNFLQSVGEGVNTFVDSSAGVIDTALTGLDERIQREQEILDRIVAESAGGGGGAAPAGLGAISDEQQRRALELIRFERMMNQADDMGGALGGMETDAATQAAIDAATRLSMTQNVVRDILGETFDPNNLAHQALQQIVDDFDEIESAAEGAQAQAEAFANAVEIAANSTTTMGADWAAAMVATRGMTPTSVDPIIERQQAAARAAEMLAAERLRSQQRAAMEMIAINMPQSMDLSQLGLAGSMAEARDQRIILEERRAAVAPTADQEQAALLNIRAMNQSWEQSAQYAQEIAGSMEEAAVEGDRVAVSLGLLLGPGRAEGPGRDLLERISAQLPEEARQQFQLQTGLVSSQELNLNAAIGDIAGLDPNMAAFAGRNLAGAINNPNFDLTGMTREEFLNAAGFFTGPGGGQQFTVSAGQTPSEIAAQLGVSVDQVLAATGAANAGVMPTGTFTMGGGLQQIVGAGGPMEQGDAGFMMAGETDVLQQMRDQAAEVTSEVQQISEGIEGINGMVADVVINLTANPDTLLQQLLGAGFIEAIGAAVRQNGGETPGKDPRATTGRVNVR